MRGRKKLLANLLSWATVWALAAGAQLGARGVTPDNVRFAFFAWLAVTAVTAIVLWVRHLLTSRDSG